MVERSRGKAVPSKEEIYREKGWKVPFVFKVAYSISWIPLFLIAVILLTLSLTGPIYLVRTVILNYQGMTRFPFLDVMILAGTFGISYLLFGISLIIFGPMLKRVLGLFSHQREGEYPFLSPVAGYWSIVNGVILFNRHLFLEITRTTALIVLFYRLMGMKVGRGTLINSTFLHDPDLVTIGRNVTIGGDVMILGHVGERGVLKLKKVVVEDGVDIGQSALVLPGCRIGEGSVIGANSVVTKDTHIPAYEIWAGIPARRIGTIRRP